jgi:hypothetical protein
VDLSPIPEFRVAKKVRAKKKKVKKKEDSFSDSQKNPGFSSSFPANPSRGGSESGNPSFPEVPGCTR